MLNGMNVLGTELTGKLREAIRLVETDRVSGFSERITYDTLDTATGKQYLPVNYLVHFEVVDSVTGEPVKFTIETKVKVPT